MSNIKKKEAARLGRRFEVLSSMDLDDDKLAKMEEIKIALNWEDDKEEVEWE